MSTRATYQIDFTTFYIHHDGYPEGAADYFANALMHYNSKDRAPNATLMDDFHHANPRAEITPSHDHHEDTDYRYTVTTEGSYRFGPYSNTLVVENNDGVIYRGTVEDFVKQYVDINKIHLPINS